MCIKNIYSFRKDEDLRPYDKQISINAIKKIGAPLLGLAKYITVLSLCLVPPGQALWLFAGQALYII